MLINYLNELVIIKTVFLYTLLILKSISIIGFFGGLSIMLALFLDILNLLTFHITCFYNVSGFFFIFNFFLNKKISKMLFSSIKYALFSLEII